jgi:imidazolonepropionase-like amidohydrolase
MHWGITVQEPDEQVAEYHRFTILRTIARHLIPILMALVPLTSCAGKSEIMFEDARDDPIAFVHVNVVPMTSETVYYDQTVVVSGDRITAVGPADKVEVPASARVIDGMGGYLMPGLADMHIHTNQNWDSDEWPVSPLLLYLVNGVTTIRDFGPSGEVLTYALRWRDEIVAGTRIGPTIYASGKILFVSPLGDPAGLVEENYRLGFDFLKLYSYLSPEDTQAALATASELGMYSAGHIPYAVGLDQVLAYGLDEIAHVEELMPELIEFDRTGQRSPDAWIAHLIQTALEQFNFTSAFDWADFSRQHAESMRYVIDQLEAYGAPVCTTLVVDDVIQHKVFGLDAFLARPEIAYIPDYYRERLRTGEEKHLIQCQGIESLCAYKYDIDRWLLSELHQAGIPLLLGTDSGVLAVVPGFSIHEELRILVENGFTPYEAIATGTVNAAAAVEDMLGEANFGTVEVGMRADLLLIRENPLQDVAAIQDLRGVMAAGRWYSREHLQQMLETD